MPMSLHGRASTTQRSMSDEVMGMDGERTCKELLLDNNGIGNDTLDSVGVRTTL